MQNGRLKLVDAMYKINKKVESAQLQSTKKVLQGIH